MVREKKACALRVLPDCSKLLSCPGCYTITPPEGEFLQRTGLSHGCHGCPCPQGPRLTSTLAQILDRPNRILLLFRDTLEQPQVLLRTSRG